MGNFLYQSLYNILYAVPVILVLLVGIVLALKHWRRHPKVSLFVLIAACVSIFDAFFFPLLNGLLTSLLIKQGWRYEQIARVLAVIYFIASVMTAIVAGFWLAAVFTGRNQQDESLKKAQSNDE